LTNGLITKGYVGAAVIADMFIYFPPFYDGSNCHGRVLRYDTQSSFNNSSSWNAYDAGSTNGLITKGYVGAAVIADMFIYFPPWYDGSNYHGRALRYDIRSPFNNSSSWNAYDAGSTNGLNTKGYIGAVVGGNFIYFSPSYDGSVRHGRVLRYQFSLPTPQPSPSPTPQPTFQPTSQQPTAPTVSTSQSTQSTTFSSSSTSSSNTGVLIGAIIGAFVAIMLIIILTILLVRHRKRHQHQKKNALFEQQQQSTVVQLKSKNNDINDDSNKKQYQQLSTVNATTPHYHNVIHSTTPSPINNENNENDKNQNVNHSQYANANLQPDNAMKQEQNRERTTYANAPTEWTT
jgi:hypothetical protein